MGAAPGFLVDRAACRPRRALEWWIAAVNLLGCVAFGIAAIAPYFVPSHGSVIDLAAANGWTAFGGLCFLVGSVLGLPESAPATDAGDPTDVTTAAAA